MKTQIFKGIGRHDLEILKQRFLVRQGNLILLFSAAQFYLGKDEVYKETLDL